MAETEDWRREWEEAIRQAQSYLQEPLEPGGLMQLISVYWPTILAVDAAAREVEAKCIDAQPTRVRVGRDGGVTCLTDM